MALKGFLLGPENRGLNCMFTFMNTARIGTSLQGLAHAEFAYQNSLAYARDRLQMRALSGPVAPDEIADPIIVHPDVRRMLLTQKAFSEGGRMMIFYFATFNDLSKYAETDEDKQRFEDLLALLTPIAKAFMTETGFEAANHGMQIFGGHGYIKEWGMEQNVRDARISMLYEGTTGIQALDLLGRKIIMSGGTLLQKVIAPMKDFCESNKGDDNLSEFITPLTQHLDQWQSLTDQITGLAMNNPDEVNAACVDYLMFSGYVCYAYLYARAAKVSQQALATNPSDPDFYNAKIYLAQFYFQRLLPRTASHALTMVSGLDNVSNANVNPF